MSRVESFNSGGVEKSEVPRFGPYAAHMRRIAWTDSYLKHAAAVSRLATASGPQTRVASERVHDPSESPAMFVAHWR